MSQDTNVENLIINKLTKAQYESITNPDPTQLYFITDEGESISTLDDVSLNNIANGQILKYNATTQKWENSTVDGGTWGNITGTLSDQTDLQTALNAKQNTISDLSTIRSGASAGATALQPNDNITELVNNAGYITGITSSDVTTALGYTPYNSTNPNGYITGSALNGYAKTADLATVATSGSYNDLSDKPTIPSAVTESTVSGWGFTKNTGTVTSVNNVSPVNGNVTLSIPAAQVQADWNVTNTSSMAYIKNKPTIPSAVTVDTALSTTSTNPVQNKVITTELNKKIEGITSSDVTTALGYTPYNSSNPSGYQANKIETIKVNGTAQTITSKAVNITVPTNNNQLTNGAGYITSSALNGYAKTADLATVATSGSYNDLTDKPTIPAAQVQADWNVTNTSSMAYIKNKPTIPAAQVNADWNATSGVAQILNKPTIPAVGNGTVTINQGGTQKGTFTLNQSGNATIDLDAGGSTPTNMVTTDTAQDISGQKTFTSTIKSSVGNSLALTLSTGEAFGVTVKRTDANNEIKFGIGQGGDNRGIWDARHNKWAFHVTNDGKSYTLGNEIAIKSDLNSLSPLRYSRYSIAQVNSTNKFIKLASMTFTQDGNRDFSYLFWVEILEASTVKCYALVKLSARWSNTSYQGHKFEILEKYGGSTDSLEALKNLTYAYSLNTTTHKITAEIWLEIRNVSYISYYLRPTECNEYGDYSNTPVTLSNNIWTYYNQSGNASSIASTAITSGLTQVKVTDATGVRNENNLSQVMKMWAGTKAEYNAISSYDTTTLYNIEGVGLYKGTTLIAGALPNSANQDLSNLSSTGNSKFQTPLVSGTNIKTVNNKSLLGSGNIDTSEIFVAEYGTTPYLAVSQAISSNKTVFCKFNSIICTYFRQSPNAHTFFYCDGISQLAKITIDRTNAWNFEYTNLANKDLSNLSTTGQAVIDGQWVKKSATLATNVTWKTNTAVKTYSLSSYLPDDGYSYEVLFCGVAVTGTTSGNFVTISLSTDLMNYTTVCEARTRQSASFEAQGSVILPVGTDRWVRQYSSDSGNANGTYTLNAVGYRRIGTNS